MRKGSRSEHAESVWVNAEQREALCPEEDRLIVQLLGDRHPQILLQSTDGLYEVSGREDLLVSVWSGSLPILCALLAPSRILAGVDTYRVHVARVIHPTVQLQNDSISV